MIAFYKRWRWAGVISGYSALDSCHYHPITVFVEDHFHMKELRKVAMIFQVLECRRLWSPVLIIFDGFWLVIGIVLRKMCFSSPLNFPTITLGVNICCVYDCFASKQLVTFQLNVTALVENVMETIWVNGLVRQKDCGRKEQCKINEEMDGKEDVELSSWDSKAEDKPVWLGPGPPRFLDCLPRCKLCKYCIHSTFEAILCWVCWEQAL